MLGEFDDPADVYATAEQAEQAAEFEEMMAAMSEEAVWSVIGTTIVQAVACQEFSIVHSPALWLQPPGRYYFAALPDVAQPLHTWREEEPLTINQAIQWGEMACYHDCAQSLIGYDRNGAIITRRAEPLAPNGPYICDVSRMPSVGLQVIVV
jgi:hypothetical protein